MMDIRFIWTSLERQERQEYQAARGRLGRLWNLEAHWILQSPFPGWRVDNMRSALNMANHEAVRRLAERLAGLDVGVIAQALVETCRDIAVVWGGSMLLGAGAGAALGSLAGGVGAVPGALAGAGVGTQVGAWVLGALGLAALLQDLGDQIPQALRHYARGLELAWGQYSRSWTEEPNVHRAAGEIADGHVLLAVAVLSALAAYLTRGRGDPAVRGRLLQQMRENPRLGARMADWVAANEDKLTRHPSLKPKDRQVVMMSSQPPSSGGPPMTPSQLRAQMASPAAAPPPMIQRADNAAVSKLQADFASREKLQSHFEKHGGEFGARDADEYLEVGRGIMRNGTKVEYQYKGETRTGFVQFMGNTSRGDAKFGFVGTNADGSITTIHTQSGKTFWKLLNGNAADKTVNPMP